MLNTTDTELDAATNDLAIIGEHFAGGKFAPFLSVFEGRHEYAAVIDAEKLLKLRGVGPKAMRELENHLTRCGWRVFYASHKMF